MQTIFAALHTELSVLTCLLQMLCTPPLALALAMMLVCLLAWAVLFSAPGLLKLNDHVAL